MDVKLWGRVKDIFAETVDLDEASRGMRLEVLCAGDGELRREVEKLLKSNDQVENFIEEPAFCVSSVVPNDDEAAAGKVLGHYRIVREIGRGGMGTVFLATRDDGEFQHEVAIKVVSSAFLGRESLRRFRQERQILAGLNHPGIARLLDGGVTDDGLPYLVMEYVEGDSLTSYVEKHNLSIEERLRIFLKICGAFAYAHGNLVVHRDIKPSNILVTSAGEPKLLDFGLAKILDIEDHGIRTATDFRALTPAYASPEQLRGDPVTTASDIFSLGVVLYELLTGSRPFHSDSVPLEKMVQIVSSSEPAKPSSIAGTANDASSDGTTRRLRQSLKGDLDNTVLMAMRKEPERRYRSVERLADDIERHLKGLPIAAAEDTIYYRSSKFVKRHRIGVVSVAVIVLILIAGIVATAWQGREASQQRARAERRFNEVRRLANSFLFEIHDSVQNLPGSTPTRNLLVTRALEYLDSLAHEASDDSSLQRELATAYEKVGDIQGNPYVENLGDTDGALASYRKAIAIRYALSTDHPGLEPEIEFGKSYRSLGDILEQKGDIGGAIDAYTKSLAIFERLDRSNPNNLLVLDELARGHEALGDGLGRSGDSDAKLASYRKTLEIRQALLADDPANKKMLRSTAIAYMKVGSSEGPTFDSREENIRKAIAILEELSAEDPTNARGRREVGFAYYQLGNLLTQAKDFHAALEARQKALKIREAFAAADLKNAQAKFDLAVGHADMAEALSNTGILDQAQQYARQALSTLQDLATADPGNVVYRRNVALCYEKIGDIYLKEAADEKQAVGRRHRQWAEARSWYQRGRDMFMQLRTEGVLMPVDTGQPDRFADKMKQCDEAAARLKLAKV